jgi:phosphohistidine swiveling domain-containing protein
MRQVIALREVGRADAAEVGVKAAALGELMRAGLPVPEGFVVTAPAVEALDDAATSAVRGATAAMGEAKLAVRSSAIAEDLPGASFAGQYETVLGVSGEDAVLDAIRRCRASSESDAVASYRKERGGPASTAMAVIVQRLVDARAAGVAFSADPVSGERDAVVVSAVRGLGDRLVSGAANADEWIVRGGAATQRRAAEGAIDERTVGEVAALARRVEELSGSPQDIEWALGEDGLTLLQARPITSIADEVEWSAPPGAWSRNFRLGEWLGDPVTPLFDTWLLPCIEEAFAQRYRALFGFPVKRPHHVVVNGWYFASLNFFPSGPLEMLGTMALHFLPRFLLRPRRTSVALPPLAGLGVDLHARDWRERILPAYRAAVARAEARAPEAAHRELVALIDELGAAAGEYFASITFVAGYAWKAELPLAEWLRKRGRSHLPLLTGLGAPEAPAWAATSLDWAHPTLGELAPSMPAASAASGTSGAPGAPAPEARSAAPDRRLRVEEERRAAEAEVRSTLTAKDRGAFDELLARAQRYVRIREEQVRDFTLAWPVLRAAAKRLGQALVDRGVLEGAADVFFVRRDELLAAQGGGASELRPAVRERRASWERQRRLAPPLVLGELPPIMRGLEDRVAALQEQRGGDALIKALGASPGRAAGPVRVVRGPSDFERLAVGDVLVAPATTPAWTPLLARAAAVITDNGSVLAHTSVIARELGIPSIVAAVDATTRLRDGQRVVVDGAAGIVTLEG